MDVLKLCIYINECVRANKQANKQWTNWKQPAKQTNTNTICSSFILIYFPFVWCDETLIAFLWFGSLSSVTHISSDAVCFSFLFLGDDSKLLWRVCSFAKGESCFFLVFVAQLDVPMSVCVCVCVCVSVNDHPTTEQQTIHFEKKGSHSYALSSK